jgi:hypothetical protein
MLVLIKELKIRKERGNLLGKFEEEVKEKWEKLSEICEGESAEKPSVARVCGVFCKKRKKIF